MGVPTVMYKLNEGKVESEIFDSEDIPKGWVDSPEKCIKRKKRLIND